METLTDKVGPVHSGNNVATAQWQQCGSTEQSQKMAVYLNHYVIYCSQWHLIVNSESERKWGVIREGMTNYYNLTVSQVDSDVIT